MCFVANLISEHFNMHALIVLECETIFSGSDCLSNVMFQSKPKSDLTLTPV